MMSLLLFLLFVFSPSFIFATAEIVPEKFRLKSSFQRKALWFQTQISALSEHFLDRDNNNMSHGFSTDFLDYVARQLFCGGSASKRSLSSASAGWQKKKKKPTKKKKKLDNHFEGMTVAELKQLCTAAGEKVSGAKAVLVERLCQSDVASYYGSRSSTVTSLKFTAEQAGLAQSGKRFDLILRLLQHATGRGGTPKMAAEVRKRGPSMKLPVPSKLRARMTKAVCPPDSVMERWSNWKSKGHLGRVVELACKLLKQEVLAKKLVARGQLALAWTTFVALTDTWLREGDRWNNTDGACRGWGYLEWRRAASWLPQYPTTWPELARCMEHLVRQTERAWAAADSAAKLAMKAKLKALLQRPEDGVIVDSSPWLFLAKHVCGANRVAWAHCQYGFADDMKAFADRLLALDTLSPAEQQDYEKFQRGKAARLTASDYADIASTKRETIKMVTENRYYTTSSLDSD